MTTEIRVLDSEGDLVAAANLFRTAMIGFPPLAGLAPGQITTLLERGRTVGAFVKDQLVGTADAVTSGLTLPGGTIVGHAAVTHVGVLPSFTRKGVATDLMRHQLHDVAARGETVATLRASEATIYERYGYGVASSSQTIEVQTARAELRPGLGTGGPVRLLDAERVWDVLPRIYTENRPSRPGTIDRPDVWWQGVRLRSESSPQPWYVAVHGEPGSETGFARYRPIDTDKWFVSDQRTIAVEDFFAPDTNTYLGLLRFLLGLDLIDRVVFWMLPVDDPLPWLLLDRRAARVTATHDETWLRVVDVEKALVCKAIRGRRGCHRRRRRPTAVRQFDQRGYHRRRRRTNRPAPATARWRGRPCSRVARRRDMAQSGRCRAGPRGESVSARGGRAAVRGT